MLSFVYLFNLLIVVDSLFVLQTQENRGSWLPLCVAGGTKLFADLIFNIPLTVFFRKGYLLLLLPLAEIPHVLYIVAAGILSLRRRYHWKGRLVS